MRRGEGRWEYPLLGQRWKKRVLKKLGYTSKGGRMRSRNILRCDRFWTSVRNLFGGWEPGFLGGGGSRRGLT